MHSVSKQLQTQLDALPATPGVYLFLDAGGDLLYVGKAAVLRHRVRQYFQKGYAPHSPAKKAMIAAIADLRWETTDSEIGALVREAQLIKERNPTYNVTMRDDKSYFWVTFSNDDFPRIRITHAPNALPYSQPPTAARYAPIGPFTDGTALRKTLRILRSIFPYCTCKTHHKTACLNAQMGRCLGFCCNKIPEAKSRERKVQEKHYRQNVQAVRRVLMGRTRRLTENFRSQMNEAAQQQNFEEAALLRDKISSLETTLNHARVLGSPIVARPRDNKKTLMALKELLRLPSLPQRIEAYDVANLKSDAPTASMVVAIAGDLAPAHYRQFHIRGATPDDTSSLTEALRRRFRRREWPLPDLIVMDGGKGQRNAALRILDEIVLPRRPTVVALAKKEEELYCESKKAPIKLRAINADAAYLLQRLRDEAHRFARRLHHKKRSNALKT